MVSEDDEVDIFSEAFEPKVKLTARKVFVKAEIAKGKMDVTLLVYEEDGLVNIEMFRWFNDTRGLHTPYSTEIWNIEREIYEWLSEWELVKLVAIGPEDSEYFATDKLADMIGLEVRPWMK